MNIKGNEAWVKLSLGAKVQFKSPDAYDNCVGKETFLGQIVEQREFSVVGLDSHERKDHIKDRSGPPKSRSAPHRGGG